MADLAPEAYYARSYPGGHFLIVMEALETTGRTPHWMADTCTLNHALAVVSTLADLHATFWESERFAGDLAWIRPRTRRFGFEWHQRSYSTARARFLDSEAGRSVPREIRDLISYWDEHDRPVLAYWDSLPATVLHGDSHLGNTYSEPDGRAGYFDWQVMYRGPGLRDVAYFFLGAADEELRTHERRVVEHYWDRLEKHGVAFDRDAGWRDYCLLSLESLDAHMKTVSRGGYGHDADTLARGRRTVVASMLENDVPGLLRTAVERGRP